MMTSASTLLGHDNLHAGEGGQLQEARSAAEDKCMQLNFHGKTNDDNGEKIAVSQAAISYGPAGR